MKSNKWNWIVASYLIWNICAYSAKMLFKTLWYDKVYFLNERVFVLVVFLVVLSYVPKNYKWVIRAMILVAGWKLAYIVLVITDRIKPNDWASLMGVLFMIVLGYMTIRWEKR